MTPADRDRRAVLEAGRAKRIELIRRLEELRKSRVICMLVSDRPELSGQLAPDILSPFHEIVGAIVQAGPKVSRLDIWVYGPGGDLGTVCAIHGMLAHQIPEGCQLSVLIPFKAASALTFFAFGADCVLVGDMGQFSPIDAQVKVYESGEVKNQFSVEDIRGLFKFSAEMLKAKQNAANLLPVMDKLLGEIRPSLVGKVRRVIDHSERVGIALLRHRHRRNPGRCPSRRQLAQIVSHFTSFHGLHEHPICCEEARELGLGFVERADEPVSRAIWEMYRQYCSDLDLDRLFLGKEAWNSEIPPQQERLAFKNACLALLESQEHLWAFTQDLVLRREIQGNVAVQLGNVSLQVNLPELNEDQKRSLLHGAIQQAVERQVQAARQALPSRVIPSLQNAGWTRIG